MIHDTLNLTAFRSQFTEFASTAAYPDLTVNAWYATAGLYVDQTDDMWGLSGSRLDFALQLMTCHLLRTFMQMTGGQDVGFIQSASTADVTTAMLPPPAKDGWEFWLSSTPYGLKLWALLKTAAVGGWAVGGSPETSAFRKVGGWF